MLTNNKLNKLTLILEITVPLCTLTAHDQLLTDLALIIGCFVFHAGKRNQDVQVQRPHLHPPESVRTVQESCKPLFPRSAHPTGT